MKFKEDIEQYNHKMKARVQAELTDIHQIQERLVNIETQIITLNKEIQAHQKQYAEESKELATKQELIADWENSLEDHTAKLNSNKMLVSLHTRITKNYQDIEQALLNLRQQELEITNSIAEFHRKNPYFDSNTKTGPLESELQAKQQALSNTIEKIEKISRLESEMNRIHKFFIKLLRSWHWRSNPLAEEQKHLEKLSQEIVSISESLQKYHSQKQEIDTLHEQEIRIDKEKEHIRLEKEERNHIEATKQAISESEGTIKVLRQQIETASKTCKELDKKINSKNFQQKVAQYHDLSTEKKRLTASAQQKSLELAQIDDPARTKIQTTFKNALLHIAEHQEEYLVGQQQLRDKNTLYKFFQSEGSSQNSANFLALSKLQIAIKAYQKGIPNNNPEHQLLGKINTQLILWQTKEELAKDTQPLDSRLEAHKVLNQELTTLIKQLPVDNPLHAAPDFIAALTKPLEVEAPSLLGRKR